MDRLLLLSGLLWCATSILVLSGPAEEVLTPGNISAARDSNVTLHCCLALSAAVISLVSWNRCSGADLVVYLNKGTANICPAFREKISLAAEYGITLHLLGLNDTGDYCCKFHTFPFGIYEGRMFLEVTESAQPALGTIHPSVITCLTGGALCAACLVFWLTRAKKKMRTIHVPSPIPWRVLSRDARGPSLVHGATAEKGAVAALSTSEQKGADNKHKYFNVLHYKSHAGSVSTAVKMADLAK
ncbi:T-cell immunoreceptor with Ig and ITIM domains isoform X2 [Dromaius novaehollandiae]|uniref:T-cell immunoreceptor with Ig and ITIM domains isoform X2 n=1 Tax=Dromaius novaehollandiae TaxID=8790 RepID=UPI000E1F4248|nr:T-cell immunoreceptor with Ig and ITIM domains isoform X2 [Dromaius novaehollandiae]